MQMLISVVVPVYKVEKYLNKCVQSIVNQTYKNLEIILVDDGSPDNCPAVCDEWAKRDERIKVIHKPNGGLSSARNAGMNIATGDYIGFVDSDDWVEPDIFEFLLKNALEYDAGISRCGLFFNFEDDKTPQESNGEYEDATVLSAREFRKQLVEGGHVRGVVWNKLYRMSDVGSVRFETEDGASEDIMFNNRMSRKITKCVCEDAPKYHYLRRTGAITMSEFDYNGFSLAHAMESFMEENKDDKEIYRSSVKGYLAAAYTALSQIISSQSCLDEYDSLRESILKYKKEMLLTRDYSAKYKIKTLILWTSPKLYNKLIKYIRT